MGQFYLPILKAKEGEFNALSKLNFSIKSWVYPLFEITQPEYDNQTNTTPRTLEEHLTKLCVKISKKWPYDNAFMDIDLLKNEKVNGHSGFETMYDIFTQNGYCPMPIVSLQSSETTLSGIDNLLLAYPVYKIGIRITIDDIGAPDFEHSLVTLLSRIDIEPQKCHLIFDLKDSNFSQLEDFTDGIIGALEYFPFLGEWLSFTICGGAFPATNLIKPGVNEIPRGDWQFYKMLLNKISNEPFNRMINYGDYSMIAPGHFEFDFTKMSRSANIRYTLDDKWYVIKGKALKKSEDFRQYVSQTTDIISSGYYLGEDYSEGDLHITKCSTGKTTPGNPSVWKWVGNNHHITKVVNDLFANPSGSSNS